MDSKKRQNPRGIQLLRDTTRQRGECCFPEHHFNFIAYNEVDERANVTGAPLADYIGCIYRISNPMITEKFDMNEYATLQKPVIIAVSSAWANKRYGDMQILLILLQHWKFKEKLAAAK
nr:hypothetical protein [Tanacetum cinerariifolium]